MFSAVASTPSRESALTLSRKRHLGAFVLLSICSIENRFAGFSNEHEKISAASAAEIFCGCPKRMHIRSEMEQQGSSRGQGPPRMRFCFPFVPGAHMSPGDKRKISAASAAEIFYAVLLTRSSRRRRRAGRRCGRCPPSGRRVPRGPCGRRRQAAGRSGGAGRGRG